jgi:L-asparaginase II
MEVSNPILVELTRNGTVESFHRGAIAVMTASGTLHFAAGDVERPVFLRSSAKPLQAVPLLRSGAELSPVEIALACGSHSGSAAHIGAVAAWLARLGLTEADLECGAHIPLDKTEAARLVRHGLPHSQLHNNCSGKHAGFLTLAQQLGAPTQGYIAPDHPVQKAVSQAIAELCGVDLLELPCGTDGCGIPVHALPLRALALGAARLAAEGAGWAARLRSSMANHPEMVAGEGYFDTIFMRRVAPRILCKRGAEGVMIAIWPEKGLGVALKIDDGAGRASEIAMAALLKSFGAASVKELEGYLNAPLLNVTGKPIGIIRPAVFCS